MTTTHQPAEAFLRLIGKDPAQKWFRTIAHRMGGNRRCSGRALHGFNAALEADDQDSEAVYFMSGEMDQVSGKAGAVTNTDITLCSAMCAGWDRPPDQG
jgi:hypothetical protein